VADIASKVLLGFGGLLILAGLVWLVAAAIASLRKRPPKIKARKTEGGGFSGITDLINAFKEFMVELRHHSQPIQLILLGVLLLLVGAALSLAG
jgi:hypothetical protein